MKYLIKAYLGIILICMVIFDIINTIAEGIERRVDGVYNWSTVQYDRLDVTHIRLSEKYSHKHRRRSKCVVSSFGQKGINL